MIKSNFSRWGRIFVFGFLGAVACSSLVINADDSTAGASWVAPWRASKRKNPIAPDKQSIARGQDVYMAQCASCHGDSGKGNGKAAADLNPKPHDLHDPSIWKQSDGALFWKISEGRKPMPAFSKLISETDRWNVINYIHKFAPESSTGAAKH